MKDRVPLYPGRVKLTPVSGQENVYDMVRADQPTQEGDPLNKSTFLTDNTASLFGLDDTAVPNDVFNILKNVSLIGTSGETYKATDILGNVIGGFTNIQFGSYVGTGTYGLGNPNSITSDFPIKLAIIIRYSSGRNMLTPEFSSMSQAFLTTSFVSGAGFPYNTSDLTYGKMSSDGKTYSWYHSTNVNYQQNTSGYTYYYVLFG